MKRAETANIAARAAAKVLIINTAIKIVENIQYALELGCNYC